MKLWGQCAHVTIYWIAGLLGAESFTSTALACSGDNSLGTISSPCSNVSLLWTFGSLPTVPDYNSKCLDFLFLERPRIGESATKEFHFECASQVPPLLPLQYQPGCRHGLGSNAKIEMRLGTMKHQIIKPNYIRLRNSPSPVTHSLIFANAWCLDVPGLLAQVQCPYQAWCGTAKGAQSCSCVKRCISSQETYMCGTKLQYCS